MSSLYNQNLFKISHLAWRRSHSKADGSIVDSVLLRHVEGFQISTTFYLSSASNFKGHPSNETNLHPRCARFKTPAKGTRPQVANYCIIAYNRPMRKRTPAKAFGRLQRVFECTRKLLSASQPYPSGVSAHRLVHVEEAPELGPHILELAGLVPGRGLDRVTMDRITDPQHLRTSARQISAHRHGYRSHQRYLQQRLS